MVQFYSCSSECFFKNKFQILKLMLPRVLLNSNINSAGLLLIKINTFSDSSSHYSRLFGILKNRTLSEASVSKVVGRSHRFLISLRKQYLACLR